MGKSSEKGNKKTSFDVFFCDKICGQKIAEIKRKASHAGENGNEI